MVENRTIGLHWWRCIGLTWFSCTAMTHFCLSCQSHLCNVTPGSQDRLANCWFSFDLKMFFNCQQKSIFVVCRYEKVSSCILELLAIRPGESQDMGWRELQITLRCRINDTSCRWEKSWWHDMLGLFLIDFTTIYFYRYLFHCIHCTIYARSAQQPMRSGEVFVLYIILKYIGHKEDSSTTIVWVQKKVLDLMIESAANFIYISTLLLTDFSVYKMHSEKPRSR